MRGRGRGRKLNSRFCFRIRVYTMTRYSESKVGVRNIEEDKYKTGEADTYLSLFIG